MNEHQPDLNCGGRACRYCGGPIPQSKPKRAVYCSPECRSAQYYAENREKRVANSKKYYDENREKVLARKQKWNEDNREKKAAYDKAYKAVLKKEKQNGTPKGILFHKRKMLERAKGRAAQKNLPFNITLDDFELPATCPVLGTEILLGTDANTRDQAPSLDRVIPALGYVKGNVLVISARANRIKNDATVLELRRVAEFFENHINENWMKP